MSYIDNLKKMETELKSKGYTLYDEQLGGGSISFFDVTTVEKGSFTAYIESVGAGFNIYNDNEELMMFISNDNINLVPVAIGLIHEKRDFIEYNLSGVLHQIDSNIKWLYYELCNNFDEFVIVEYSDKERLKINITADSKQAILKDVVARLF